MKGLLWGLVWTLAITIQGQVLAGDADPRRPFDDVHQEQLYHQLTEQLRCPQCQNNSIADSNAMVAVDLRDKVRELLLEGKSKREVVDYMVARYGYFVTYDPPLTPVTILLWLLPAAVLVAGIGLIYRRSRRRVFAPAIRGVTPDRPGVSSGGMGVMLAVGLLMLVVSAGAWYATNNMQGVNDWRRARALTPALYERLFDSRSAPLDRQELLTLALGLRSQLQRDSANAEGWVILGRIGILLGDAGMAIQAYGRAHGLSPDNHEAASGYAQALLGSADPLDNQQGMQLLRTLIQQNNHSIPLLSLLAFSAFEQQRYDEAVFAWRQMLALLPEEDVRRPVIEQSIQQALVNMPAP